jgi:hypothetical protein
LNNDPVSFGGAVPDGGEAESMVACRQLGNELGYTLVSASKVGSEDTDDGSGMAYEVTCAGTESTLDSCPYFTVGGTHSSFHPYDVGVSCTFLLPNNECEECAAGKFSGTSDLSACHGECTAGSYSTVGAASCEQVRVEGGRNEREDNCR